MAAKMRRKLSVSLFSVLVYFVSCSQETWPQNSEICDKIYQDDKLRLNCRKSLSGGLECHDKSACTSTGCTAEEVAKRNGMLCGNKFPFYNGGYPMSDFVWDSEDEKYTCLVEGGNGTYCSQWGT